MMQNNPNIRIPPIGFSTSAYRAYLQMSHRKHVLVRDSREKMSATSNLEEVAAEIEQEIDVDIDNAEFFITPDEPFISKDIVERIYADLQSTSFASKLFTFEELVRQSPRNSLGPEDCGNNIDTRIQKIFHRLSSGGVVLVEPAAISHYLLNHQDLIELLPKVLEVCYARFEEEAQLSLGFYSDPEVVDNYLSIYVRQENYQDNFLDNIQSAREGYLELLNKSSGWIHLTTDFDFPR